PMLDFKLFLMYTRVFRPRLIWTIYLAVITQVFVYSYVVHHVWEANKERWITPVPPPDAPPSEHPVISATRILGLSSQAQTGPLAALPVLVGVYRAEVAPEVRFFDLEMAPHNQTQRDYFDGKRVKLTGRYVPLGATS